MKRLQHYFKINNDNKQQKIQNSILIITLFFICFVTPSFGQKNDDAFFYIDSLGRVGEEANHQFVRVIKQYYVDKDDYQFLEYYRSGKIYFCWHFQRQGPHEKKWNCSRLLRKRN